MKVILLQDLAKIGRRYEIANVPDGYALNKLIPGRMAEPATPANIKRVQAIASKQSADASNEAEAFTVAAATLKNATISVAVEANEEGSMFEALKTDAVLAAVKDQTDVILKPDWIVVTTPIKTLGDHTVLLSHGEAQGECSLTVVQK